MNDTNMSILVIEDDLVDQKALQRSVDSMQLKYALTFASSCAEAREALRSGSFEVLLLDLRLSDGSGLDLLSNGTTPPAIVITGTGNEALASKAFRKGAYDYVVKDSLNAYLQLLPDVIESVMQRRRVEAERDRLVRELQEAVDTIKTLRGFIPICSSCKKIRDDSGYWQQIEEYIRQHSEAEFTHGICPDCTKQYIGELDEPPKPN